MTRRLSPRSWLLVAALALVVLHGPRRAEADTLEDVKQFIAGRPELAPLAGKLPTKVGDAYQIAVGGGAPPVFVVKHGATWAVALVVDGAKLSPAGLLGEAVGGDARVRSAFVVVGGAAGALSAKTLGGDLKTAVAAFGKDVAVAAGVNVYAQLEIGRTGALGQLQAAGLLPGGPVWLTGTVGQAAMASLLGGNAPDLKALDLSLSIATGSWVPAPFTSIASPKLTLGETKITFVRSGGSLAISGEQANTTLAIGGRTFAIPRTTLTFTASGGGFDIVVEGRSSDKQPWRDAFGLSKVDLEAIQLQGRLSTTRTAGSTSVKGFALAIGARLAIHKRRYDGHLALTVENSAVKELSFGLVGALNLGFLPGGKDFTLDKLSVAVTPATNQAALAGELRWRGTIGRAALVFAPRPTLLVRLGRLDLAALVGKGRAVPGLSSLPPLDALIAIGFGRGAGEVANLPSAAQALIDEIAGSGGKVKVGTGLTVLTKVDAAALGADRYGLGGPILLAGSVDVAAGALRLAASLPSLPPIPGLPKGFGVEAPELFVAVDQKGGAPVGSFGLGMRLRLPVDSKTMLVRGAMSASSAGTLAFTGTLESNWANPFGLAGITIVAPVAVTVGVGADASIDLGIEGGVTLGKQTFKPMAMCVNLQAAAPAPVPKKLALRFKGSELGPRAELELVQTLVKSVTNGPLKGAALDPATQRLLAKIGPKSDGITKLVDTLGLGAMSFKQVDFALTTPGVTCDLPAIQGLGARLSGTATFLGKRLGTLDASVDLARGLVIKSAIADLELLDVLRLKNVKLDVAATLPGGSPPAGAADDGRSARLKARLDARQKALADTKRALKKAKDADDKADLEDDKQDLESEIAALKKQSARASGPDLGHFYVSGRAEVLRAAADIRVEIDRTQATFEVKTDVADLGAFVLTATTEGEDLQRAKDFELGIAVAPDAERKLLAKLGAALRATADARKQASAATKAGGDAALKAAQAELDRLDATAGKDFRKAKKALAKAKKKYKKAQRAIAKAKDKCEEDLGVAASLCGTMDAAKATLKAGKKGFSAAEDALKAIKKSAKYARLQAARATIASIKAGTAAVDAGLSGWSALDRIGQQIADGGAAELIQIDELELVGSLKRRRGTLHVTASVGDVELDQAFEVDLAAPGSLDVGELAAKLADEITEQAMQQGSAVWKQLRKKK